MNLPDADLLSSILGGEDFAHDYAAYLGTQGTTGSNVWNTTLLIGWDQPGGTYYDVPRLPRRARTRPPRPASSGSRSTAPAIQFW